MKVQISEKDAKRIEKMLAASGKKYFGLIPSRDGIEVQWGSGFEHVVGGLTVDAACEDVRPVEISFKKEAFRGKGPLTISWDGEGMAKLERPGLAFSCEAGDTAPILRCAESLDFGVIPLGSLHLMAEAATKAVMAAPTPYGQYFFAQVAAPIGVWGTDGVVLVQGQGGLASRAVEIKANHGLMASATKALMAAEAPTEMATLATQMGADGGRLCHIRSGASWVRFIIENGERWRTAFPLFAETSTGGGKVTVEAAEMKSALCIIPSGSAAEISWHESSPAIKIQDFLHGTAHRPATTQEVAAQSISGSARSILYPKAILAGAYACKKGHIEIEDVSSSHEAYEGSQLLDLLRIKWAVSDPKKGIEASFAGMICKCAEK
jgi:hypothetical protein